MIHKSFHHPHEADSAIVKHAGVMQSPTQASKGVVGSKISGGIPKRAMYESVRVKTRIQWRLQNLEMLTMKYLSKMPKEMSRPNSKRGHVACNWSGYRSGLLTSLDECISNDTMCSGC